MGRIHSLYQPVVGDPAGIVVGRSRVYTGQPWGIQLGLWWGGTEFIPASRGGSSWDCGGEEPSLYRPVVGGSSWDCGGEE